MPADRVLLVHNHYQQPGGEDTVFAAEAALLRAHGHDVVQYTIHNERVARLGAARTAMRTVWSGESYAELSGLTRRHRPRWAHFHNTFPLVSPSAYYAVRASGVPVIQTLHNYRLLCPGALLFREGAPCERCVGRAVPLPGILHGCYRGSRAGTAVVGTMVALHRAAGTWDRTVDAYIALSEFSRGKFVAGGLPADRIEVKPNFVHDDPGIGAGEGGYALFVGRLAVEKGIDTLLDAWERLPPSMPLRIVGNGPAAEAVRSVAGRASHVQWLGHRPSHDVVRLMRSAKLLVQPSPLYENFPMVVAEAFACGLPVVASDVGAMRELIVDGRSGVRFRAGDAPHLAEQVRELWDDGPRLGGMRRCARAEYERSYSATANYQRLLEVYGGAERRFAAA